MSAVATLLLLAAYHGLRIGAARCTGTACDWYIPLSLLLPLAVLVMVAVTGVIAISTARRSTPLRPMWTWLLVVSTALGVVGPMLAATVFRDSPDVLVPVATVLFLLAPLSALAYSILGAHATTAKQR